MKRYRKRDNRDREMKQVYNTTHEKEGQGKEVLTASSHSKIKGQEIKPESYRFKTNGM